MADVSDHPDRMSRLSADEALDRSQSGVDGPIRSIGLGLRSDTGEAVVYFASLTDSRGIRLFVSREEWPDLKRRVEQLLAVYDETKR